MIPPGIVCDACNSWLGKQVDAPFVDRFDMRLTRGLEGLSGRCGEPPLTIDGHDATCLLEVELGGGKVDIYAAHADETAGGGLDIEIRPKQRDPADIVARTIRALWKIALGCIWLDRREAALDSRWDDLRCAVLGAPFRGYLLQAPFTVAVTRRMHVDVRPDTPAEPSAMGFFIGGVALAVPLAAGARITRADARRDGWEVHATDARAPRSVRLRLEPSER